MAASILDPLSLASSSLPLQGMEFLYCQLKVCSCFLGQTTSRMAFLASVFLRRIELHGWICQEASHLYA